MKTKISILLLFVSMILKAQLYKEKFESFPFGSIRPTGWLQKQMQKDMQGFVGNLDIIVPSLINDPIYGTGRLHKNSKPKDLGILKSNDALDDEQYKWWNGETQSNWWDGYIRAVSLQLSELKFKLKTSSAA